VAATVSIASTITTSTSTSANRMMLRRVIQQYEVAKHRFLADNLKEGMVFVDVAPIRETFHCSRSGL
jgi:hypothetical protein